MRSIWKTVPTFGAFALVFGNAANAADMGRYPPSEPPLLQSAPPLLVDEFSSGWYLRGDVGYRWNDVDSVANVNPPPGVRGNDLDTSWLVGAGVGYKWEWFRTDFTLDYGTKSEFTADSNRRANDFTAKIDSVTGLVNVYGDLGTWYGFTPYVGVGVGFAHLQAADFRVASDGGAKRRLDRQLELRLGLYGRHQLSRHGQLPRRSRLPAHQHGRCVDGP